MIKNILIAGFMILAISSCDNDEEKKTLSGNWLIKSTKSTTVVEGESSVTIDNYNKESDNLYNAEIVSFKSSKVRFYSRIPDLLSKKSDYYTEYDYEISGNKINLLVEGFTINTLTYTKSNTEFTTISKPLFSFEDVTEEKTYEPYSGDLPPSNWSSVETK